MPRAPLLGESRGQGREDEPSGCNHLQAGHEDERRPCAERIHGLPYEVRHGHGEKDIVALHLVDGGLDHAHGGERDVDDPLRRGVHAAGGREAHEEGRPEQEVGHVGQQHRDGGRHARGERQEGEGPLVLAPLVRPDASAGHGDAAAECRADERDRRERENRAVQREALPRGVVADHVLRPAQEAQLRGQRRVGGPVHAPPLRDGVLNLGVAELVVPPGRRVQALHAVPDVPWHDGTCWLFIDEGLGHVV
mmetsp:Transcript_37134/g.112279  ORF Transcript_37134/g.112279 Transcript_37134/m.112279 type:complete len:250 (-) Transcript_37134:716-1465(-)